MRVSYRWLKDYVELNAEPLKLGEALTMVGFELELLERLGEDLDNVVAARIERVEPHPKADRLSICTINEGSQSHQVVCGAPGLEPGQVAAWARPGAQLPNGMQIKEAKLRGVQSEGMLCAADELGLFADHSALYYLAPDAPLGVGIIEAAQLDDWVLELGVTPNRPDVLSMIGVAREVAAIYGQRSERPALEFQPVGGAVEQAVSVEILDPERCPRYCGMLVRNVTIGPSPQWMIARLNAAGLRSINNVVDITNFVLLECGQPLHAFDLAQLGDSRIVVRRAADGEKIVTLDEVERTLSDDDLLICDGSGPVALAGIMGGQGSMINDQTTDVFIESAYFEPTGIRRTSHRLGLSSDSSFRFERGIDYDSVPWGLHRAATLVAEFAGGTIVEGYIDNRPRDIERKAIELRVGRANQVLGIELSAAQMAGLLESVELTTEPVGENLLVKVPAFRVDIFGEADLHEEVARLYGYDKIPETLHAGSPGASLGFALRKPFVRFRQALAGCGFTEAVTISFIAPRLLDTMRAEPGQYVRLGNPLSEDLCVLRDTLLPSLLICVARNNARGIDDCSLFELRRVFKPVEGEQLPDEHYELALVLGGNRSAPHWSGKPEPVDLFDLKGAVEELLAVLKIENVGWRPAERHAFLPGVCAELIIDDRPVGVVGKLARRVLSEFKLERDVFAAQIDAEALAAASRTSFIFHRVSRHPAIQRDLAVVVDEKVAAARLLELVRGVGSDLLIHSEVFDLYRGAPLESGKKSIAISCTYQAMDRTLTDEQIDRIHAAIVEELAIKVGAHLRQ
ncbi:MAG: phenylalanine--tRNA ligase subunit beta [Candidatus Alcyoniella australis]|nr:phenylalanine--tRNA ligase subunit beta [Candidatus Alcyoniella australis]